MMEPSSKIGKIILSLINQKEDEINTKWFQPVKIEVLDLYRKQAVFAISVQTFHMRYYGTLN